MIRVEGISHSFGPLEVLHNLWFEIPEKEIFGFIGPNGAGKTTTLRMMATLLEPDQGWITIDGLDVVKQPDEVRRILGFMPDAFGVYERLTVDEYLEFYAAAHGIDPRARTKTVAAVMELTELGGLRDRLVSTMSKGMCQRLGIAQTLLHDPKVLILDEPANGLDPRARIEMRELIEELQRLGKTIVISSHILTELSDMCTSVGILEKGNLLAVGTVDEIGKTLRPDHAVVLRLIEPHDEAEELLSAVEGVLEVTTPSTRELHITYEGGEEVVAEIVSHGAAAGLRIIRVEPEHNDLERIFLEITRGALQ
jgi:ABC-2 type transport system ATP-binding protein